METEKHGKNKKRVKKVFLALIAVLIIASLSAIAAAQPSPHNVQGHVYKADKVTGVGNLPVFLNDTAIGTTAQTVSQATPPFAPFLGAYSASISGNDGDLVVVRAWNKTYWGTANTSLLSTTTTINIYLNKTRKSETNVTILRPANNSIRNTTNPFNVTANVTILGADATSCSATIAFSDQSVANITDDQAFSKSLGDLSLGQHSIVMWNVSGLKQGSANVSVSAACSSDGVILDSVKSYKIRLSISDTTPPAVKLILPLNRTWTNASILFVYNVTETTGIRNCSLYYGGKLNQTSRNLPSDTRLNFTLNNSNEGTFQWKIGCFDSSTNSNGGNSSFRVLYIDNTAPNVTLFFPINGSGMGNISMMFHYNVSDNYNATNCSLILNNNVKRTNHTITLSKAGNFSESIAGNYYNWSVNCSDNAHNVGFSGYFELRAADIKVNLSDIVFSISSPVEKQLIRINATVYNIGTANATKNFTFQFFENDPASGGIQLGKNFSVNLTAGNNVTFNISYLTRAGVNGIVVLADIPLALNGTVVEALESNNKANRTISIASYHIYNGDIVSNLFLDTSSAHSLIAWVNSTDYSGNIYVADSDSVVAFSSLMALTRNASRNLTLNDTWELDIALNLTYYPDSINRTYTENGRIKSNESFLVYASNITEVPIVNSTNSTNFLTGILWDMSDINNGEFNGSQDVVFVTKMNRNNAGLYGNYDFEIKVPANLRRYLVPNAVDSLSFYREIT